MRYIGNKENVIPRMYEILIHKGIAGRSLFDFFSGTTSVSKFYKRLGYTVSSSDFMYFSYVCKKPILKIIPRRHSSDYYLYRLSRL